MTLLDQAQSARLSGANRSNRAPGGFTLIELMIVVAVIGILTAVALPSYLGYVRRGAIQEGLQALSADRVKMEQYFMDNRTYTSGSSACGSGAPGSGQTLDSATAGKFTISCTATATTYTITATGSGTVSGFVYTIDQGNSMHSSITKAGWPSSCSNWISRPGDCTP